MLRQNNTLIHPSNIIIWLFYSFSSLLLLFSLPLTLPEQSGHYVLAWKHGIAVLTAGDVKVTSNPRIRLMPPQGIIDTSARSHSNSYNLEIQNVRTTDAGDYACQIGSIVPKEIVHSLEVLGELIGRSIGRLCETGLKWLNFACCRYSITTDTNTHRHICSQITKAV